MQSIFSVLLMLVAPIQAFSFEINEMNQEWVLDASAKNEGNCYPLVTVQQMDFFGRDSVVIDFVNKEGSGIQRILGIGESYRWEYKDIKYVTTIEDAGLSIVAFGKRMISGKYTKLLGQTSFALEYSSKGLPQALEYKDISGKQVNKICSYKLSDSDSLRVAKGCEIYKSGQATGAQCQFAQKGSEEVCKIKQAVKAIGMGNETFTVHDVSVQRLVKPSLNLSTRYTVSGSVTEYLGFPELGNSEVPLRNIYWAPLRARSEALSYWDGEAVAIQCSLY